MVVTATHLPYKDFRFHILLSKKMSRQRDTKNTAHHSPAAASSLWGSPDELITECV